MADRWWETSLLTLLSNYVLKDIYNADAFGLFYECFPFQTYQTESEKCSGGKLSKIQMTGSAVANAVADKLPMLLIGKTKKPRCLKNVRFLPFCYRNQQKTWMSGVLFEEWVRETARNLFLRERKLL